MYLNVSTESFFTSEIQTEEEQLEYTLELRDNPVNDFVEIPEHLTGLRYLAILSGAIKGALAQTGMRVEVKETSSVLRGDRVDTLRIKYLGRE
ncbi:hypothetical protein GEMRC1_008460 [Eukaryota sp. GEM-RC1]